MKIANAPSKFGVAWASGAATVGGPNGDGYRRVVSQTSLIGVTGKTGYASFVDGFVPVNATPVGAGGIPPFVQDMNGCLNAITSWDQYAQAGGQVAYDATFAAAIGGYPQGACLPSTATPGLTWQSTADGNATNPDGSASTNWQARAVVGSTLASLPRDAAGNGGLVTLQGSNGAAPVYLDNYGSNGFRVYSTNSQVMAFNPASGQLSASNYQASGGYYGGNVTVTTIVNKPDTNNNRVHYFTDANGQQTGFILQQGDGALEPASPATATSGPIAATVTPNGSITIKATGPNGGSQSVSVDTSGGLHAWGLSGLGGSAAISGFQGITTTTNGAIAAGTGGISTTGPMLAYSQLNLYGRNVSLYNQAANADGSHTITAQFVYNDVTPKTDGPQTEIWCEQACMWLDSGGTIYTRQAQNSTTFGKVSTVGVTSERALKQDTRALTGGLAALHAAPPIRFRYNDKAGLDTEEHHIGHFYEDLVAAMPEATLRVGGHGQVDQRYVVPYLHSAVLELAAQNVALAARLDAAEAREGRAA